MSRRFVVAIAGAFVVLAPGAVYAFTLLASPLTAAFGWKPGQVTWAFALYSLFIAVGGAYGGYLADRRGPKLAATFGAMLFSVGYSLCGTLAYTPNLPTLPMLFLYYGVIAGTGSGMAYIAALTAIMRWSKTRRGLAGGFVIMGFGLGTLVFGSLVRLWPPFLAIQDAAKQYAEAYAAAVATAHAFDPSHHMLAAADVGNLMTLFWTSGIVFLFLTAIAARFLSLPSEEESSVLPTDFTPAEMFADPRFYVLWATLFLNVFGGSMVIAYAAPIMSELTGASIAAMAALYSTLAFFNGLGRIAFGALSDRIGRRWTFVAIFATQATAFIMLDSLRDPIAVAVAVSLLLFSYGGGFGTMPATNADFFGTKFFGTNYGAMLSAWGIAAVTGSYFITILKAASGSYVGMMQPISVLALVALFFPMIVESRVRKAAPAVPASQ